MQEPDKVEVAKMWVGEDTKVETEAGIRITEVKAALDRANSIIP